MQGSTLFYIGIILLIIMAVSAVAFFSINFVASFNLKNKLLREYGPKQVR